MLEQVLFEGRLVLCSDLHIGTGDTEKLSALRPGHQPASPEEDPQVALVARAADGMPIIPATALKGALRKALIAAKRISEANALFGAIKNTEWEGDRYTDEGQPGIVWLRFAPMTDAPPPGKRPFWCSAQRTIITTHVAIDRKTGTAADKKLFSVERIPAGASFTLRGVYIGTRVEAECDLPLAFEALARDGGLAIGADARSGDGRVALAGKLRCHRRYFDAASGDIERGADFEIPVAADAAGGAVRQVKLAIFCRGPYLTVDPSKPPGGNEITAARRNANAPLLPASSVLGVLRTRAAWLAASDASGDGNDDVEKLLLTGEDPKILTRTQRLFGVSGWRGLVQVVEIAPKADGSCQKLPSVVIDRFAGGTLDSALYQTEAFCGVGFAITLRLERRRWGAAEWPSDCDIALFDALIDDLKTEGLMLGHGVNRGFGWFDVDEIDTTSAAAARASR